MANEWLRIKPPLGARIDNGHPLASGMRFALLFNEGALGTNLDLIHNRPMTVSSARPDYFTKYGVNGLRCDANNEAVYITTPSYLKPTRLVTVLWRGVILGTSSDSAALAGCYENNTDASPYHSYILYFYPGGTIRWSWNNGSIIDATASALTVGQIYTIVGVLNNTNGILYLDGVQAASQGQTAGNITYQTTSVISVGQGLALDRNSNALTDLFYIWPNRALTPSEVWAISKNPYQVIRPARRRVLFSDVPVVATSATVNRFQGLLFGHTHAQLLVRR